MLRFAGALILLAAAVPAQATDWTYVDSANTYENITFIDKDAIRTNAAGNFEASMFSIFAEDEDGASAFRFSLEVDCKKNRTRLVTGVMYDVNRVAQAPETINGDWEGVDPASQGGTINKFICTKGAAYPNSPSSGAAAPFDKGKEILANQRAGKAM